MMVSYHLMDTFLHDCVLEMIIVLIAISMIVVCSVLFLIVKATGKSLSHIFSEIKYEIIYNIIGMRAILEDYLSRNQNVALELPVGTDKVAVITGGARGIGVEVVKKLVKCDFQVIIGCRNIDAGYAVIKNIRAEGIVKGDICVYKLDLASLESTKSFAAQVKQNHPKIHLLINNAGKMFGPYVETIDGYESQFGINYLAHFFLTHLLLPELKAAGTSNKKARIINVSSCAHVCGAIDFGDINLRVQYISSKTYAQSKLAQVLFSNYLNNMFQKEDIPVASYSLHPGIVNTELFNGTILKTVAPWIPHLLFMTPEQGARTTIFTCISSTIEDCGGAYISNCQVTPTHDIVNSTVLQEKLFDFTQDLLRIEQFGKI